MTKKTHANSGRRRFKRSQLRDITLRKQAEEALQKAKEKYHNIFENAVEGIFQTTPDGRYLSANPALARMFGYESPEDLVTSITDIGQQQYLEPARRVEFKRLMEAHGVVEGFECQMYRRDGGTVWVSEHARAVRRDDGTVLYYEGTVEDITDRKRAEEALRESQERFRSAFGSAPIGMALVAPDGHWLQVNPALCEIVGYSEQELLATTFQAITHPDDLEADLEYVRQMLAGEIQTYQMEKRYFHKLGRIVWILLSVSLVRDVQGKPLYFISQIQDITEHKRVQRRQAAQYNVTRVLSEFATLTEAGQQLLKVIGEALGWEVGELWTIDPTRNLLRCVETWHAPSFSAAEFITLSSKLTLAPGAGLAGRVWQSGESLWITDSVVDPNFSRAAVAAEAGLHGAVGLPILLGNRVLGVLMGFSQEIRPPDEDLLAMLSNIGSQIGQFIERKQSEEALRQSEDRFRAFMDNNPAVGWMKDEQGRYVYVNKMFEQTFRMRLSEWLGRTDFDVWPPETAQQFRNNDLAVLATGKPSELSELVPGPDGGLHDWWVFKFPFQNAEGTKYVGGVGLDVTDRKQTQKALRETETRFQAILDNSPSLVFLKDIEGRYLLVNHQFEKVFHRTREEVIGKTDDEIFPPMQASAYRANDRKALQADAPLEFEEVGLHDDGPHTSLVFKFPLHTADGQAYAVGGIATDITERKRVEEALRQNQNRISMLLESTGEGIYGVDLQGWCTFINQAAARMLGYRSEEMLGKSVHELVHHRYPDGSLYPVEECRIYQAFRTGQGCQVDDEVLWRRDGTAFPVRYSSYPLVEQDKITGAVVAFTDITDRKKAEVELQNSLKLSRALSRRLENVREEERTRIARDLHDEIGQALTALKLNLQVAQPEGPNELRSPPYNSISIIDRLLERVRTISLDLRPSLLDDLGLIATLKWWTAHQTPQTVARLELIADPISPRLPLDMETACFRIVEEAVNNATKYAQAEHISVILRKKGRKLDLLVRDDGAGFDVSAALARSARGESMGLLGMEERVTQFGGLFTITSRPRGGTEIRATFPLDKWARTHKKTETSTSR